MNKFSDIVKSFSELRYIANALNFYLPGAKQNAEPGIPEQEAALIEEELHKTKNVLHLFPISNIKKMFPV